MIGVWRSLVGLVVVVEGLKGAGGVRAVLLLFLGLFIWRDLDRNRLLITQCQSQRRRAEEEAAKALE